MKERSARLRTIKRLIKNEHIESQEALLSHLVNEGYSVTQATLSRDLKLLKVGKVSDGWHGYYYTLPGEDQRKESEKHYIQDLVRGFVSLEVSGPMGVIRTQQGHAPSLALALDRLQVENILGSVAGDDTVLFVIKNGVSGEDLREQLRERFPDLDIS
jgi:transcriptional regulator of arginine metabolism